MVTKRQVHKGAVIGLVALLFVGGFVVAAWLYQGGADLPTFGATVGGVVGTLWSLAGILVVYLAFLGQQEELVLQREELTQQREQITAQTDQFRRQQDESTFFHLLGSWNDSIDFFEFRGSDGRAALLAMWQRIELAYSKGKTATPAKSHAEVLDATLEAQYPTISEIFGTYLKILVLLFRFIEESDSLTETDRLLYSDLIACRLSTNEVRLITYGIICSAINEQAKLYFEEHRLFRYHTKVRLLVQSDRDSLDPAIWT